MMVMDAIFSRTLFPHQIARLGEQGAGIGHSGDDHHAELVGRGRQTLAHRTDAIGVDGVRRRTQRVSLGKELGMLPGLRGRHGIVLTARDANIRQCQAIEDTLCQLRALRSHVGIAQGDDDVGQTQKAFDLQLLGDGVGHDIVGVPVRVGEQQRVERQLRPVQAQLPQYGRLGGRQHGCVGDAEF
ncbi:hypothetical protein WS7_17931 [Xanthomonas citri pv. malvacearum str. GSPB2388]|nr:hypothetical protein WS7_17931 [Xanthomonas citri pv. malvacearum str. GSPB2388]